MTTIEILAGASSASAAESKTWDNLPWKMIDKQVTRLQMRIAKAEREGKKGKVKALQRILTSSFYGKCAAVKRVVLKKGGKTPGVDGIVWRTSRQKMQAALSLKRHGYNPLPSRRIYVPKKQKGKLRPISIPAMKDKAMQTLWNMALIPIAEERADLNSYGFRPKRSTQDAIEQCFKCLCRKNSAQWIFEGDIHSCFDQISHEWLLENIPMDKQILRKFLKTGFMEKKRLYTTELGTGQGSSISPTLALMALSGIEAKLISKSESVRDKEKIHFISYADDFVITGYTLELLEEKVIPIVIDSLKEVGLELSKEKSKITHIDKGFNFLGHNIRKYKGTLLTKPAKENVKVFLNDIRKTIKANYSAKTENLINLLNPKIRGWANYFRGSVASKTFSYIDSMIYRMLKSWMLRRHPNKNKPWIVRKYYIACGPSKWNFHAKIKDEKGNNTILYLYHASKTSIKRHIKIKSAAKLYDPKFKDYFKHRESISKTRKTSDRCSSEAELRMNY